VASPSHRLATRPSVSALDFMDEEILLKALGCCYHILF